MTEPITINRIRHLVKTYRLLFVGSQLKQKFVLGLVTAAGFIAVLLQVTGITVIFYYTKHLVSGHQIAITQFSFNPRDSILLLVLTTGLTLSLFGLAAILTFLYNFYLVKISCKVEKHLISNLYLRLRHAPTIRTPSVDGSKGESAILKVAIGDTRCCARAYLMATSAIVPCVTLTLSILALFAYNWIMTIVLIPVAIFFIFFVYKINISGVNSSKAFEKNTHPLRDLLRKSLQYFLGNSDIQELTTPEREAKQKIDNYVDSYQDLISLPYRSNLATDLFLATTLSFVLFGLSASAIVGFSSWTTILIYLVALRYAMAALKQATSRFTVMNRFYPQVSRYFHFSRSLEDKQSRTDIEHLKIFPTSESPFKFESLEITRGSPVMLFCKLAVTRYTVEQLIDVFLPVDQSTSGHNVAIISGHSSTSLSSGLENVEAIKENLNLQMTYASSCDPEWLFIDSAALALIDSKEREKLFKMFTKCFIFVYARDISQAKDILNNQTSCIVLSPSLCIIWAGTISKLLENQSEVKPYFISPTAGTIGTETVDEELDLVEDF